MYLSNNIISVAIIIVTVICVILLQYIQRILRLNLPYRVNCWFCNSNCWVKFPDRNSWICKNCDQYNGFTKDGDYNRQLVMTPKPFKVPRYFQRTPKKNGLCQECNLKQELKVAQLASFVPLRESNFDEEIELFSSNLEKCCKLCSPCKKVLQAKLHTENETILSLNLLKCRTPEKKSYTLGPKRQAMSALTGILAKILFLLFVIESQKLLMKNKVISSCVHNCIEIIHSLFHVVIATTKTMTFKTFPVVEDYFNYVYNMNNIDYVTIINNMVNYFKSIPLGDTMDIAQKALSGVMCSLQIVGHIVERNSSKHAITIDIMWIIVLITSFIHDFMTVDAAVTCFIKIICTTVVLLVDRHYKVKCVNVRVKTPPKRMNHLVNGKTASYSEDDESSASETDDDVSLNKFGLLNVTGSSSDNENIYANRLSTGKLFNIPRNGETVWKKLQMYSPSTSPNLFVKPMANKFRNLNKDINYSRLDEGINCLNIGSPTKSLNTKPVFSIKNFTTTPNFIAPSSTPMAMSQGKNLIWPSKLGHSTSWVAGGYWGSDDNRQVFNLNGSRSSSQSSGFESQGSSGNQRNVFSQPSSRGGSICGDLDRNLFMFDRFQCCSLNNKSGNYKKPQNFSQNSLIYPQMKYDGYVHIPQPRYVQPQNGFLRHRASQQDHPYVEGDTFKAPGGSGLIKLPPSCLTSQ